MRNNAVVAPFVGKGSYVPIPLNLRGNVGLKSVAHVLTMTTDAAPASARAGAVFEACYVIPATSE